MGVQVEDKPEEEAGTFGPHTDKIYNFGLAFDCFAWRRAHIQHVV
jgi:hypothetical protein